jgi:hypothetical protein
MNAAEGLRALYRRLHESMTDDERAAVQMAVDAIESNPLLPLLRTALEKMENEVNEREGRDAFGLECGNCVAGVPIAHSFGCEVENAIRKAGGGR